MRTFRVLVAVAVAAAGLAVLAPGATASVPAASAKVKKFCKVAAKISSSTPDESDSASAKKLASTTRKAARAAPNTKVKNAMNSMADYFEAIGDAAGNPAKAAAVSRQIVKYSKATATYTGYYISNCSFAN